MRAAWIAVAVATAAAAQDNPPIARYVPPGPDPAHVFVLDSAHILTPATVAALQDSARALQGATGADVAWVTLPTLGGRPIEEAALYIGRSWRIGNAGQPGDPLRNRGLVILFIPDKTKTAGPNFRVEVGNGLEGTITDSRSRSISNAMRTDLRAKRYDAAYLAGWSVAANLVREDFATHGASAPAPPNPPMKQSFSPPAVGMSPNPGVLIAVIVIIVILLFVVMRRARGRVGSAPTTPGNSHNDDDDQRRRNAAWLSTSASDPGAGSSGGDSGGSSGGGDSGGGGSFGDGGGFSGGGSSDTI